MKKLVLIVMAMVMCLTLVACGNNDENNASVQAKIDELAAVEQEILTCFTDNGYLVEGSEEQAFVDTMQSNMEKAIENHKKLVDDGGYSDEDTADMIKAYDSDIAGYQDILDSYTE